MRFLETSAGKTVMVRLEYGSDLLNSLREISEKRGIEAGQFFVIGAVKRATFSFYDQKKKKYIQEEVRRELEILSCLGNIAKMNGKTIVHAHIALSDEDGKFYGGHLTDGTVIFAGEAIMTELKDIKLERKYDEVTGLNLFDIKQSS